MQNVNDDFFGERDDVLVFYNSESSTPFTSNIPRVLENSFSSIRGVSVVSPEIFFPAIVNDEPIYGRGVKFEQIIELDNAILTEGKIPQSNYEILVGKALADRMYISVDSSIDIYSIVEEEVVKVFVVGIYDSDSVTSDEILVSISIASRLSTISDDRYTHIRAKYDVSIISKEEVLQIATSLFPININLFLGNGTYKANEFHIQLKDVYDNLIFSGQWTSLKTFNLVRGNYILEIKNGNYEEMKYFSVTKKSSVSFELDNYNFILNYTVYHKEQVLKSVKYRITDQNDISQIYENVTDDSGELIEILPVGNYSLEFTDYSLIHNFTIIQPISEKLNLDILNVAMITQLENNSLFIENSFSLDLEVEYLSKSELSRYEFRINNTRLNINNNGLVYINATDGNYNISLFRDNYKIWYYTILINSSIDPFQSVLKNYAHYQVNQSVNIKLFGLKDLKYYLGSNETVISAKERSVDIVLSDSPGFHTLYFEASDVFDKIYYFSYRIVLEYSSNKIGWSEASPVPVVKPGDLLSIWTTGSSINVDMGSIIDENTYRVPDNSSGTILSQKIYNISFTIDGIVEVLSIFIVKTYAELFILTNGTVNYYISNTTVYNISTGIFEVIPEIYNILDQNTSLSFIPEYWHFSLANRSDVEYNLQDKIYFNNSSDIELTISNIFTGNKEVILITTNSFEKYPVPYYGIDAISIDGRLQLSDYDGNQLKYTIIKDLVQYTPITINNELQLSPGNYSVSVKYNDQNLSTKEINWELTVLNHNPNYANYDFIASSWGYLQINNLILSSGNYYTKNTPLIIKNYYYETINNYRDINQNAYIIDIPYAVKGNYSLSVADNTITSDYLGPVVINETSVPVFAVFTMDYYDMAMKYYNISIEFMLGKVQKLYEISFLNATNDELSDIELEIYLQDTNNYSTYLIDKTNPSISFVSVNQNMEISYFLGGREYTEFYVLKENMTILLGDPLITFIVFNKNMVEYVDTLVVYIDEDGIVNSVNSNRTTSISKGNYTVFVEFGYYYGNTTINVYNTDTIEIYLDVLFWEIQLDVLGIPIITSNITISHYYLNFEFTSILYDTDNSLKIELPVGMLTIKLFGKWGMINQTLDLKYGIQKIIIDVGLVIANTEIDSPYQLEIDTLFRVLQIGIVSSSGYLKEFLKGALIIIQTILISQIVIIMIILIYNIIEIVKSLTFESKREIITIFSLGASTAQVIFAYSKTILISSILISLIGQLIAGLLINLLVISNNTIFFGHQFIPNVLSFKLFMINYSLSLVNTLIGLKIAYNGEIKKRL